MSLLSLTGIAMSIYFFMGGFDPLVTARSTNNVYSIAGKFVHGHRMHQVESKLFVEIRDLIQNGKLNGDLCLIDYRPDTLEDGEINRFIGILLGDDVSAIPAGFKVIELQSHATYKAALSMHPLVMPNSQKVETALRKHAATYGDSLQNFSMEIFYPDNSILVEMFAE
ncbi:hypothetical protein N6H18_07625 [Reichenbachiella agarivorans]|uniref:GyrI-like small molecule binding domain-containing protein n=1 Tax=Reichenbachiella agarivorans TaxID=2979464 RepID=A0ABY6CTG7_9BACT|nr:hypothetical protein [Reichenbachiella agarivorans]UXP33816.1 hypothetical protein N6H18_07625 [Reichenbachiella agarivorans]